MSTLNWRRKFTINGHHLDVKSNHFPDLGSNEMPGTEPIPLLWEQDRNIQSEDDLLLQLKGRVICSRIRTIHFIGAHLFQEQAILRELFPNIKWIYLYEPIPELYQQLCNKLSSDPNIRIFPYAISDNDGTALFHLASNNGASSSLLRMGKHREIFPDVQELGSIHVKTRCLQTAINEHGLESADMLFVDVQGAEYQVLSSLTPEILKSISVIYTEASTEPIYEGSRTLQNLREFLEPEFVLMGFVPLTNEITIHGNALFIRRDLTNQMRFKNATLGDIAGLNGRINSTISGLSFIQSELEFLRAEFVATQTDLNGIRAEFSATQIQLKEIQAGLLATQDQNQLAKAMIDSLARKRISYKLWKAKKSLVQNLRYLLKNLFSK